jgi:hypothetical protein
MSHIEDLVQYLAKHTTDPHCLPAASEQVIKDIKGIDYSTIVAFKVQKKNIYFQKEFFFK